MKKPSRTVHPKSASERNNEKIKQTATTNNPPTTRRRSREGTVGELKSETEIQQNQLNEVDREWFHIRIRDLELKLERATQEKEVVREESANIHEQLRQALQDKTDIAQYFQRSLQTRQDQIKELEERLTGLLKIHGDEKLRYESQITELKASYATLDQQLTSENQLLQGKLTSLEEFRIQKEDLHQRTTSLEQQLRDKDELHRKVIEELECQLILRTQDLKEEHEERIKTLSCDLKKQTLSKLTTKSRKALEENSLLLSQIQTSAKQIVALTADNDAARKKLQGTEILVRHLEKQLDESQNHSKKLRITNRNLIQERNTLQCELSLVQKQLQKLSRTSEDVKIYKISLTEMEATLRKQEQELEDLRQSERRLLMLLKAAQDNASKQNAFSKQARSVLQRLLQESSLVGQGTAAISILELFGMEDALFLPSNNSDVICD